MLGTNYRYLNEAHQVDDAACEMAEVAWDYDPGRTGEGTTFELQVLTVVHQSDNLQ
jgi:hypothetical protein